MDIKKLLKMFKKKTKQLDYKPILTEHANQFVDALLNGSDLITVENANDYRRKIKSILIENSDNMDTVCLHCGMYCTHKNVCNNCMRTSCDGCFEHYYINKSVFEKRKFCSVEQEKNYLS